MATKWRQEVKKVLGTQGADLIKLKVTLENVKPDVVRELIVPLKTSLGRLHWTLQSAMGWHNCHMHDFRVLASRLSIGDPSMCEVDEDEDNVSIQDLLARGVKKLRYNYDFGDDWKHTIVFGRILNADPDVKYPRCTGGQGACPPEDSGGPWGYMDNLSVLADPKHAEYKETREWMGVSFDPDHFSVDEVNARLHPPARSARPGPAKGAKSAGTKPTKTKPPTPQKSETAKNNEPLGKTFTTPSGFKVTRFTGGGFIEVEPGRGFEGKATLPIASNPHFDASSFFLGQIPPSIRKIDVYTEPIPSTWGTKKMSSFCKEELNLKTTQGRAFLFFNSKRDMLRVYWHDGECEQLLERVLFEGAFLVPLTGKSGPWMQVARDSLPKLLKASPVKKLPSPIRK